MAVGLDLQSSKFKVEFFSLQMEDHCVTASLRRYENRNQVSVYRW